MRISFSEYALPSTDVLVVFVLKGGELSPSAKKADRKSSGAIKRALAASRFEGNKGQLLEIMAPHRIGVERLILAGLGAVQDVNRLAVEAAAGAVVKRLMLSGAKTVTFACDTIRKSPVNATAIAAHAAYGAKLASYRFDKYKTKDQEKDNGEPSLGKANITVTGAAAARRAFASLDKIADGVFMTRDLVTEPGNVLFPQSFAKACRELEDLGVEVDVMNEARLRRLGMNALLGVSQGSSNEAQVVVMRWTGTGPRSKPIAFVGKGVTFDSGGISLKPAGGMEEMKWDMGGAGAVTGVMKALAGRKAKVNAVGVIGLVENMPSGSAQRPGDVVASMSGQTIEVINTDAEGRLVLADVLWYTKEHLKPQAIVDLATLTGAMIIALGHEHAGVFANDDQLAEQLLAAGQTEGEKLWRMPVDDAYDKDIQSAIADMKNTGAGRSAGSIAAAMFLKRFVGDLPWAHIDIAGVAWSSKERPTVPKGGTGFGVRLLDRLVQDHYEKGRRKAR